MVAAPRAVSLGGSVRISLNFFIKYLSLNLVSTAQSVTSTNHSSLSLPHKCFTYTHYSPSYAANSANPNLSFGFRAQSLPNLFPLQAS